MASFTDQQDREWKVRVDVPTLRDVQEDTGLSLENLEPDQNIFDTLESDSVKLVAVLYSVCQEQIEERGMSEKDFARIFRGEVLSDAVDALWESLINFFPARKAKALKRMQEGRELAINTQQEVVEEMLDKESLSSEVRARTKQAISSILYGDESTSMPGSSVSIPTKEE